MKGNKVIAVIPALNEEKTIANVINSVKTFVDDVVVIDDASLDNTASLSKNLGATVLSHDKTVGYDCSINDGFALAFDKKATVIFTFDADGQHIASDIPKIVQPILNGEADLVVGKRPVCARLMEHIFSFFSRIKIGVSDPLCGLKAYHVNIYKETGYFDNISSIGTQLMFEAGKKGYKIRERHIGLNKRVDDSRFGKRIKANYKIFKAIIRTLFI